MGFFSSLFGGSSSKSVSNSASGFNSLPSDVKKYYTDLTSRASNTLSSGDIFKPIGTTEEEQQAYNLMQLPTSSSGVSSLVDTYMNPFTSYITDAINREAAGGYSAYKSALADSGQMGSNREFLNAAASDNARLNSIGSALSNEYNTALSTGLNQNQQNIVNLLAQGEQERSQATQNAQSGLSSIQAFTDILNALYGNASTGTSTSKSSSTDGILGTLAKFMPTGR